MITLRPYQTECADGVDRQLEDHDSTLAVMATGTGKTEVYLAGCLRLPGRSLVLAHRDFLIRQPAERLKKRGFTDFSIEMADDYADEGQWDGGAKIVLASKDSLRRPKRLARFDPSKFQRLVIDEAHHAVAGSYRAIIDHFRQNPDCKLVGLTATPKRADQLAMGQVFDSVAYDFGIEPAVDAGWLVPVRQQAVKVDGLDFSKVRSKAGDFDKHELEAILKEESQLHAVAAPTVDLCGDLPALVFCVTVAHARSLAAVIDRYKPGSAAFLCGKHTPEERLEVLKRYRDGQVQFLCNVALFLEGFDAPRTAAVVMARPTKSVVLYAQVLGRGTRPLPGLVDALATEDSSVRRAAIAASPKPYMLALDFVGNSGRHKIVTAADLLGGRYGEPVREYAKKTAAEEGKPMLVEEALERADAELALELAMEARRKRIRAQAEYRTRSIDPFGRSAATAGTATLSRATGPGATEKQIRFLVRLGVSAATASTYSRRQASSVIDKLKRARGWT